MSTESDWQWRAAGFDDPNAPDSDGQVFEYSRWTNDRAEAERAVEEMRADDPPFDEVFLERRSVTYGPVERVEPMGYLRRPDA